MPDDAEAVAMTAGSPAEPDVTVYNVLRGEAAQTRSATFGTVGTVFSGSGVELVWVSKQDEPIDPGWFSSDQVDLILVMQGRLKFEFEAAHLPDRVLGVGDLLVLPAGERCRAYRWPRDTRDATIFVAAYPADQ